MPRKIAASIGRIEARIGREAQAIALPRGAGNHIFEAIQECIRQEAHQAVDAIRIFLLPLVTMLLDLGVVGQGIQPVQFGLIGLGAQRLAVDRDQAGDISILGFDNVLGGVVLLILFAQKIPERPMVLTGVHAMLRGAAHQSGGIDGRGLLRLCRPKSAKKISPRAQAVIAKYRSVTHVLALSNLVVR
jgi:hypothetical protein